MPSLPPFISNLTGGVGTTGIPNAVGAGVDPTAYGMSAADAALEIPTMGGVFGLAGQQRRIQTGPGGENPYLAPGMSAAQPSKVTMGELVQQFYQLSRAQQIEIEQKLWDAGYYTDMRTGQPMKSAPEFGSYAAETTWALENAAREAAATGRDLNTVINDAVSQGKGEQQHQIFKPGVVGHGYRNVIDLRNPHDVEYATDRMAQQLLGRVATQQEKDAVTQTIQSQDFADGMAKYNAQEQMTYQDFQARVAERDAQMYFYTGQVPSGQSVDSSGALSGSTPQQQIMAYFQGKGLSAAQAAGIVGNLQQESGLNPNSPGGGIAQWQGDRWNNLVAFAQQQGGTPNDLKTQLDFLWHELTTTESGSLASLQQTTDAASAAQSFSNHFERPGNPMMDNRVKYANAALQAAPTGASMNSALTNPQALLGPNGTANASNAPVTTPQTSSGTGLGVSGVQSFISTAESQIGVPYQWGGTAPGQGFDCSGLVQWAMKQHGVDPGRTTYDQFANPAGANVSGIENAQPGDLLFFDPTGGHSPEHVGIYLGGGQMLDADHTGDKIGIRKSVDGYGTLVGIKRFPVGSGQSGSNIVGGQDTYIPGSNTIMTQPGSPDAEAYNQLTQGPARVEYGAHNILNGIGVVQNMIKAAR